MAAPDSTTWGSIVGNYCKLGIYTSLSNTNTSTTLTVEIWLWTKWSCTDSNNRLYYDNLASSGSATTEIGSMSVATTNNNTWNTANQIKLKSYSYTYTRGTSAVTRYLYARLNNIDKAGAPIYASKTVSIPKLASYTITYNANGGSGAPSSQTKWYGKNLTLSTTKPTRTGYSFLGWATSSTATSANGSYDPGDTYSGNANLTLYAVWKANTYTITYNANGGSGAPSSQTKTYGVALTLSSTKPTRANYNFKGWGTSASATTVAYAAGASYTANAAAALYAIWELAYVKPRVTDLTIARSNNVGTISDTGTWLKVGFTWETDQPLSSIKIEWEAPGVDPGSYIRESTSDSTFGIFSACIGDGQFSLDSTYSITITVTDANGYTVVFGTLDGTKYVIDLLYGGLGIALGKPAELEGVFEVAFQSKFTGGILQPVLEPETDLNDVIVPNTYTGANISSNTYGNCPVSSGTFTLRVENCGEEGQLKQTYISCSKYKPEIYARFYYQGEWGDWFWASTDEVLLYENADGSDGTISLTLNGTGSATAASHYRYLDIYFIANNGDAGGYTRVWNPSGKSVELHLAEGGGNIYFRQTVYTISGSTLTPNTANASYVRVNSAGTITVSQGTNYIKIVRVIGRA